MNQMGLNLLSRVLIVDDMPAVRSILHGMLQELGFVRIAEAEDGDMAWDMIREASQNSNDAFGLVIADWNMPGMSGVELLRAVRSFSPTRGLPFFISTSKGNQACIVEATRAGVTDYVVKPYSAAQLWEKVQQALSP